MDELHLCLVTARHKGDRGTDRRGVGEREGERKRGFPPFFFKRGVSLSQHPLSLLASFSKVLTSTSSFRNSMMWNSRLKLFLERTAYILTGFIMGQWGNVDYCNIGQFSVPTVQGFSVFHETSCLTLRYFYINGRNLFTAFNFKCTAYTRE